MGTLPDRESHGFTYNNTIQMYGKYILQKGINQGVFFRIGRMFEG